MSPRVTSDAKNKRKGDKNACFRQDSAPSTKEQPPLFRRACARRHQAIRNCREWKRSEMGSLHCGGSGRSTKKPGVPRNAPSVGPRGIGILTPVDPLLAPSVRSFDSLACLAALTQIVSPSCCLLHLLHLRITIPGHGRRYSKPPQVCSLVSRHLASVSDGPNGPFF